MEVKILRIGDPHAKVNNLGEMRDLVSFALETAKANGVNRIELLGDLYHTHAVLRLEVQEFWTWTLNLLSDSFETVVLVGNHDMSGNYSSKFSALSVFSLLEKRNLKIIEKPTILGAIGYIPYMHDNGEFIATANELADLEAKVLVVHQTLQGSKYENGFYAADGADASKISEKITNIISGHIHSKQEFGRIDYPGTARWDSVSDANQEKGIWIYTHDDSNGQVLGKQFISTENVCSPLHQLTFREGEVEPVIPRGRVTLELVGSSEWVGKQKQKFKGKVGLKSKITDSKKLENRKAGTSFADFTTNIFVSTMDKEHLLKLAKEMGIE